MGIKYNRFKLINTFGLVVPETYRHMTQLANFLEKYEKEFLYYNRNTVGFKAAELNPNQKFTVKIFQIMRKVVYDDCVAFLEAQKCIFVGAQGLSLVYQTNKDELPIGRIISSFGGKTVYLKDNGVFECHTQMMPIAHDMSSVRFAFEHRPLVAIMICDPDGYEFHVGGLGGDFGDERYSAGECLLCFCEG